MGTLDPVRGKLCDRQMPCKGQRTENTNSPDMQKYKRANSKMYLKQKSKQCL